VSHLSSKKNLDQIIVEAVDESLLIMGETARNHIYSHLKKVHGVDRKDIPEKLEKFDEALEGLFGAKAVDLITQIIAKRVYDKIGMVFNQSKDWKLTDYVSDIKKTS